MKRHLPSLRVELSRTLGLISAAWLLTVLLTVMFAVRHEVDELMDDTLRESAEVIYGLLSVQASLPSEALAQVLPAPPHRERLVWQVVDQQGLVLRRSHMAPRHALHSPDSAGIADTSDGWRVFAMPLPEEAGTLFVAQTRVERKESRYESILFVAFAAFLASIFWALLLNSRVAQTLHPLAALSRQIQNYDPLQPETDLAQPTRAEIEEVTASIRGLGARLAQRVQNERAFAAHAAHALRTPLAGMDAQLALAQREVSDAARPRIERARAAAERLKRVVTSLLALFRSAGEVESETMQLTELANRLLVDRLELHVPRAGTVCGDPNLITAALANLLDNSVRHGAQNAWLEVHSEGNCQFLTLRDDGPGVESERLSQLQTELSSTSVADRVGLGLRLAKLVAQAHGGDLSIKNIEHEGSSTGGGFVVQLTLKNI